MPTTGNTMKSCHSFVGENRRSWSLVLAYVPLSRILNPTVAAIAITSDDRNHHQLANQLTEGATDAAFARAIGNVM